MDLQIRLLSLKESEKVYCTHMKTDFPRNELRPFSMIKKLFREKSYYTYGIFEGQDLRAYAFLLEEPETRILLFDYFAVCKDYRSKGYGTEALKLVLSACKEKAGIILEVEDPMAARDEAERVICQQRIVFYQRCGIRMSEVHIRLFGVNYCMMYKELSDNITSIQIIRTMEYLYQRMLPGLLYKKVFHIV